MSDPSSVSGSNNSDAHGPAIPPAKQPTSHQHVSPLALPPDRILTKLASASDACSPQSTSKPTSLPLSRQLWATSVDSPQLSERDCIFATTYFPSNSPPSSLLRPLISDSPSRFHEEPAGEHVLPLPGPAGRELTFASPVSQPIPIASAHPPPSYQHPANRNPLHRPPIYIQTGLVQVASTQMGTPVAEDADSSQTPLGSPIRFTNSPARAQLQASPQIDEEKEAERLRYRSWREGKPELPKPDANKASSKSGDNPRLDRKIQAVIPNLDPHTVSTRSRKSSQYLGLFKEKDAAEEQKRRESRAKDRSVEATRKCQTSEEDPSKRQAIVRRRTAPGDSQQILEELDQTNDPEDDSHGMYQALSHGGPQSRHAPTSVTSSKSIPDLHRQALLTKHGVHDSTALSSSDPEDSLRQDDSAQTFPILADQRHDLVSPTASTTSSHRTERGRTPSDFSLVTQEEYESEKEHISSATYIPHRQIRPDTSPVLQATRRPALHRTQSAISPDYVVQTVEQPFDAQEDESNEVEISLKSQDEVQVWHGEMVETEETAESTPEAASSPEHSVSSSASEADSYDSATSTVGYDSETEVTPSQSTPKAITARRRKRRPREPVGAVPLMPFRHQVGGHNTVFQFSRQTICKKMNNRENVFYEVVEKYHPELLDFMPRYIGVLNVTYTKAPKKRRTESFLGSKNGVGDAAKSKGTGNDRDCSVRTHEQPRIVSHSQRSTSIPQVIFNQNRHIIPDNLFKIPTAPSTPQPSSINEMRSRASVAFRPLNPIESISRGSSPRPHIKPWGSTRVNRKLQEQALREVFAPPIIHRHRHHGRHHLSSGHLSPGQLPVQSASVGNTTPPMHQRARSDLQSTLEGSLSLLGEEPGHSSDIGVPLHAARTGPQEGEEHVEQRGLDGETSPQTGTKFVKRRHSGGGLRRRPIDVVSGTRSNLEFHEEDGYGADQEDEVFTMDDDGSGSRQAVTGKTVLQNPVSDVELMKTLSSRSTGADGESKLIKIEKTVEAFQAQADGRVEMFILLEDLTAKMEKPCVLDLKMGTRQYGVEADEKKQRSQRRKCAMTTSRALGVRVCGMQVWNAKTQDYVFQDKYFGRDLKAGAEFQDTLKRFFFDGHGHTSGRRYIPVILEQLTKLEAIVRKLPGYRFYASSLLILYDQTAEEFGHDDSSPSPPPPTSSTPRRLERAGSGPAHTVHLTSRHRKSSTPVIKVKIVDFANCVTREDTSRAEHATVPPKDPQGVDRGYLRGLRTLKLYFQRVWHELLSDSSWVERGEGEGMAVEQRGAGRGTTRYGWHDVVPEDPGAVSV